MDQGTVVAQPAVAVFGEQQWSVQIDEGSAVRHQQCRGHRERGRDHSPHHDVEAPRSCILSKCARFGKAAGLVELDVDHVVTPGKRIQRRAVVAGLVRADGDETFQLRHVDPLSTHATHRGDR